MRDQLEKHKQDRKDKQQKFWDPHFEKNPTYDIDRRNKAFVVDYEKAIQNLTDILIDTEKFEEMNSNIFMAIDEDDSGVLQVEMAEEFARSFLRGNQIEGMPNTDFEMANDEVFIILAEQESGEVTKDEMSKFMNELLKHQIKNLQERLEK